MTFGDKLDRAVERNHSLLCVGLDPDHRRLPPHVGQFAFNKAIIDATADLVCAYKPNPAFYEALGAEGVIALKQTCDYIRTQYPDTPIIIDAKRGDIGNTNQGYAEYVYDYLKGDAVTVSPYMGGDSLEAFRSRRDKGMFVLCRTSNLGSTEFQGLKTEDQALYLHVANQVTTKWNEYGNCYLVVGAPFPDELRRIRALVGPDLPMLVPGVGAQGGNLSATLSAGLGAGGKGLIINASRGVIFADTGRHFATAARRAALELRDQINEHRSQL
jgi:orotidine-5'-phosphate decarboxylase